MSAEFQRGLGWSSPLLSLQSKYCFMILQVLINEVDNYFAREAEIMDIVYANYIMYFFK